MSSILVRPFRRSDRDQLAQLVNQHAAAVVPGLAVSVSSLLSDLERQPGEFVVDPWVQERLTLVAEQRGRVVAAAHLHRYADDDQVGPDYRHAGSIEWLVFWPQAPEGNPFWSDGQAAAAELMAACLRALDEWGVTTQYADGQLPVPGVSGVPEQWPHVADLYQQAGFVHEGQTEVVYLARVEDLPHPATPPLPGLTAHRSVGINGTRISAVLGSESIGYVETEIFDYFERTPRRGGWADVGNLHVAEEYRRRGVATWLLGQLGGWLELARVDRLLDYAYLEGADPTGQTYDAYRALLAASGFRELARTRRGWVRRA
jgi:GNAT superfamily N-acetyltransferase